MTNLKFYGGLREKKNSKLRLASKQKSVVLKTQIICFKIKMDSYEKEIREEVEEIEESIDTIHEIEDLEDLTDSVDQIEEAIDTVETLEKISSTKMKSSTEDLNLEMPQLKRSKIAEHEITRLESNDHLESDKSIENEPDLDKYSCTICSYSLKSFQDLSDEEKVASLKNHVILEHFKADIPPDVMKAPPEPPKDNDDDKMSTNEENLYCDICDKSYEKHYQLRIHQKYHHKSK